MDALASLPPPAHRIHRVEHTMGTAISVDVRDAHITTDMVDRDFEHLRSVDARFSTFKPESEVSRLSRGDILLESCSPELREVLTLGDAVRLTSNGYFDIRAHRSDGEIDPSGLVKGWAVEGAAKILDEAGARNYYINAGGDAVIRGEAGPMQPWRVGIRHPEQPDWVAAVLEVRDLAVATSGAYERGEHVIDPYTHGAPQGVLSMTVVGPSLTFADAYATAALAMGPAGLAWIASLPLYTGCCITADRRLVWTPGFESHMAAA
jgi:thiamine biosynthesis lipoprotein